MTKEERRQRDIEVYLEWIRANVPQLTFQREEYRKQVITFAIEQTRGTQFWLGLIFAVLLVFMSYRLSYELGFDKTSILHHTVVMTIVSLVLSYVTNLVGRILIRRRIRELAGPIL